MFEKIVENSLDCKDIKPVNPKENESWAFIGRTDAKAIIFWPPDAKTGSLEKTLMLGMIEDKGEGDNRELDGWMASLTR